MLQQAVHQVIYPLFEIEFKAGSYGFRPKRNAHQQYWQLKGISMKVIITSWI